MKTYRALRATSRGAQEGSCAEQTRAWTPQPWGQVRRRPPPPRAPLLHLASPSYALFKMHSISTKLQ